MENRANAFDENFTVITAPADFSIIKNPEAMISFMEIMRQELRKGKNIHIEMKDIKGISCEAIAYLLCNISDPKFCNGKSCTGSTPSDAKIADIIKKSGFYTHVKSVNKADTDEYEKIFKRTGKKVELKFIEKIINFSTVLVYGQKTKVGGIYRTLVECMANTRDHASDAGKQHVPWWTTVYFNEQDKRACFTFLDNGIGIFKSIRLKKFVHIFTKTFGANPNKRVLREILEGTLPSSTGIPYRGKGLPSIYRAFKRGQISRLIIISNDVYANLETGLFLELKNQFRGTLLYWEDGKR